MKREKLSHQISALICGEMGARTSDEPIKSADEDNSPNLPSGGWKQKNCAEYLPLQRLPEQLSLIGVIRRAGMIPSSSTRRECKTRNQVTGAIVISGDEWQRCHDRCSMGLMDSEVSGVKTDAE